MEIKLNVKNWRIEEETGYHPITTFYQDFSIADNFGLDAIKDTYNRAFNEWKSDYKYMTELTMVLNWKIAEHYNTDNDKAQLYNDLWIQQDKWCIENLKDKELKYFYNTTD